MAGPLRWPQFNARTERRAKVLEHGFGPSATRRRVIDHTCGLRHLQVPGKRTMTVIRVMTEEDIPAALALWQGLPGIGLREADNPESLARFLRRNPGMS